MTQPRIRVSPSQNALFNPISPVFLMYTQDVTKDEVKSAQGAIEDILDIAKVKKQLPIVDLGVWRESKYKDSDGKLIPHMSVDWYVNKWYNPARDKVNASSGARELLFDPWKKEQPHYDVILTAQDLYTPDTDFVVGLAYSQRGTIISVRRFRSVPDRKMGDETKKQETYHEVGHVFCLPDKKRGFAISYNLGEHCTNLCAMRQGIRVPYDWVNFVYDRKRTGQVYCNACTKELRKYFGTG